MPVRIQQRANKLGLEVTERIIWEGWQPGGEYTKNITLKNVDVRAKKLKYKIPSTRFFTTKYPQPIILSSGTSLNVPVTFRPLEKGTYEDQIVFETKDGQFSIPIMAALPEADLLLPECIDFELCAVGDEQQKTFEITNLSDLEVSYNMLFEEPFFVKPSQGYLLPKSKSVIAVDFKPEGAFVYDIIAVCKFGANDGTIHRKNILMQGSGKYAYIGIKHGKEIGHQITVDFKSVAMDTKSDRTIELINFTPVNAPFQVIQPSFDTSVDKAFTCSQYHGIVPGDSSLTLKLTYCPSIGYLQQVDTFEIMALGASSCATVKCIGQGIGPQVQLEVSSLSFGLTDISKEVTRSFNITNRSEVEAVYQLQVDNESSVFNFDVKCGKLKGGASKKIIVTFKPEKPIIYYRRVAFLIHNQGALYLDVFGTCHTDQVAPGVLQRKHIDKYRVHRSRGLTRVPPEDLQCWLQEGRLYVEDDGSLNINDQLLIDELQQTKPNEDDMEEFFNDGTIGELTTTEPHVCVDVRNVDFSRCSSGHVYHKTVNVTNNTQGKIYCIWNTGRKGSPFTMQPIEQDILPLQSASFSIRFKPNVPGQFFSAELEGYAFYKSMRDHRLVDDVTLCPPWCLTTIASGHTFSANSETFLPQYDLDSSVIFSPVTSIQPSYKTLLLTRHGKYPIDFAVEEDESRTFTCKPSKGLLYDKYQVIVFRCIPDDFGTCSKKLSCVLNASERNIQEIHLTGSAEIPRLEIQTQDVAYFQPTYVGTSSKLEISIRNPCRIPLGFEWKVPATDKDMLFAQPPSGIVSSNEVQAHTWIFKPKSERKYLFKVKLIADSAEEVSDGRRHQSVLRLIGEGQDGSLSCLPEKLDFGDIVVGNSVKKVIHLQNESDCGLNFNLKVDEKSPGMLENEENVDFVHRVLELSDARGFLPARSRKSIELKCQPRNRCKYFCTIFSQLGSSQENARDTCDSAADLGTSLCVVTATGVYPTLTINDIRGLACAEGYSRQRLWDLFSIDRFNSCLDSDPSAQELIYKVPTRHSTRRRMPVHTRSVLDFNFGSSPYLSKSCQVMINLENTGSAIANWNFLFPTDLQLDMEFWAQTGEFDEDELHEMFVLDHSLFSIHPKKGSLAPGKSQVVSLSYSHSSVGVHRLPVLFKVSKGREILLNFIGITVSPDIRYLHFSTTKHMFEAVPIGRSIPPVQYFPLFNGGGQPVEFQLDTSPLDEIQEKNCGWRIFDCLNQTGTIAPGETAFISWIFSPLEAKTYSVDIVIYTVGGERTFITFTGIGFDPAVMGPTMMVTDSIKDPLPKRQAITVPEQLLYLSEERLLFDDIPLLSEVTRIVFLKNISSKFALSFRWLLESSPESEVISITPTQGYIKPLEFTICKVKFLSKGPPAIYDLDCLCEVSNETLMAKYNKELLQWHENEEKMKVHFTITDSGPGKSKSRPGSGPTKLKSIESSRQLNRSDSDLRKYEALPSIGMTSNDGSNKSSPPPMPPDPFAVHLSATARTHPIEEFCTKFIHIADRFFIRGKSPTGTALASTGELQTRICNNEEYNTVISTLPLLIMDLLEDKDFQDAIKKIGDEPVPYFGMVTSERSIEKEDSTAAERKSEAEASERSTAMSASVKEDDSNVAEEADKYTTVFDFSTDEGQIDKAIKIKTSFDEDTTEEEGNGEVVKQKGINGESAKEEADNSEDIKEEEINDEELMEKASNNVGIKEKADNSEGIKEEEIYDEDIMEEASNGEDMEVKSSFDDGVHGNESDRTHSTANEVEVDCSLAEKQMLKQSADFATILKEVFENTIFNIMSEACKKEINLTARPRLVALPPSAKGDKKIKFSEPGIC